MGVEELEFTWGWRNWSTHGGGGTGLYLVVKELDCTHGSGGTRVYLGFEGTGVHVRVEEVEHPWRKELECHIRSILGLKELEYSWGWRN